MRTPYLWNCELVVLTIISSAQQKRWRCKRFEQQTAEFLRDKHSSFSFRISS